MSARSRFPSPGFLNEARRWIAFDTAGDRSNRAFARHLADRFRALGFRTRLQRTVRRGVPCYNLLARGGPPGRPLLLNTHLDTVPAGPARRWTVNRGRPRSLRAKGGRLYGLGVADVKLNLLCQWEALRRLGPAPFRRALCLAGTFGEERGLQGVRRLTAGWRGPRPAFALVGEPSEMRIIRRHRGYLVFEWDVPHGPAAAGPGMRRLRLAARGRSAHSSTPELGVNALVRALDRLARRSGPVFVEKLEGGTAANQVPAQAALEAWIPARPAAGGPRGSRERGLDWRALALFVKGLSGELPAGCTWNWGRAVRRGDSTRIIFDLRYPPGAAPGRLIALVRRVLSDVCRRRLPLRLRVVHEDPPLDAGGKLPGFLLRALRRAGLPVREEEKLTCTEAGIYRRWGVPAAVIGPGRSRGNIHRPNESIALRDLKRAVEFYKQLLTLWCLPDAS